MYVPCTDAKRESTCCGVHILAHLVCEVSIDSEDYIQEVKYLRLHFRGAQKEFQQQIQQLGDLEEDLLAHLCEGGERGWVD